MNIPKNGINPKNVTFTGHNKKLDKTGYEVHNFYYLYDPKKYECEVELYNIEKDAKGNIEISEPKAPDYVLPMEEGLTSADLTMIPELTSDIGFAYRFKLKDKTTGKVSYAFDNGTVIGIFDTKNTDNKYNVVLNNRATINKNGPMQLIMPDLYYPGIEEQDGKPKINEGLRAKALSSVRTHANKLGGNLYGIIARLDEIEKEGVKRIVGTPFTKDRISSHLYWTENAYRLSSNLGKEKDFKVLQEELFKHDINWIADAALVNEGFGGIHMSEFLRKGADSYSKNMFRAEDKVSLGILPDKCNYTRMKIINAPFVVSEDGKVKNNNNYNYLKPTYIQFYDERLASEEQKKSDSPEKLTTYDNRNTDNIYDITHHDDAVYPFPIEVNPDELTRNVKKIVSQKGELDLSNIDDIRRMADFSNFKVDYKSAAAGLEVWDGNVDIAKLNFYRSDKDDVRFIKLPKYEREKAIEDFDRGALAVRDYALNSGRYWTKLTSDVLLAYVSKLFDGSENTPEEYLNTIKRNVDEGLLPDSVLENVDLTVISNVLENNYHLRRLDDADMRSEINPEGYGNSYSVQNYILKKAMDCPLETLPVATNLLGVLTSPYIAKKANIEEELGASRYDITKAGNPNLPEEYADVYEQVDNLYEEQVVPFIAALVNDVVPKEEEISDYGKYVISEIAPDIVKYLFVKALDSDADIRISEEGEFDFSNVDENEITIQSLGIPYKGKTLEEEAQIVVDTLRNGIDNISQEEINSLKEKINKRFAKRSLNSFKISEMIVDRTEAGLGWRIDAAKDIAAIDSVRSDSDKMTKAWNQVIDFWKHYNEAVVAENPHAYTTAEITDLSDLFRNESKNVYTSDADAERKFLEETGIIAVANYNYFFSLLPELFANYGFEDGNKSWMSGEGKNFQLREKLDEGWLGTNPGFLFQSPEDGVINSYTFFGNHDKPRALHFLALDMSLYNSDFEKDEHKKEAAKCLRENISSIDFDKISPMAVAMGSRLNIAFDSVIKDKKLNEEVKKAVSELASGQFKGREFDAAAFGTRPFEIAIKSVFDEVEYNGISIPNREKIEAKVLESILTPAFDRFYSMYKLLIALPGSPTDFAGDRVGASGAETKAKNYHQQNRNVIHWEWLKDDNYAFVKDFYENMNKIAELRNKPELSALNDGATIVLPLDDVNSGNFNEKIQSILRYNDKGSVVLTLHDLSGADSPYYKKMDRKETNKSIAAIKPDDKEIKSSKIILCSAKANAKQGLKHGMQPGTKFKNERAGDTSTYEIATTKINGQDYYYLRRRDAQGREIPVTIKPEDLNTLILYKVK